MDIQNTESINTDDIYSNIGTQSFNLYYVIVDSFNGRYSSYECQPSELYNFHHYVRNGILLYTFDDYTSCKNHNNHLNTTINNYKKHILNLQIQLNTVEQEFKMLFNTKG